MKRSDSVFATPPQPSRPEENFRPIPVPPSSPPQPQQQQDPIKPFRFKFKRPRSPSLSDTDAPLHKRHSSPSPHIPRRHRHHHRSRRRHPHTPPNDDTYLPNSRSRPYMPPNSEINPDTAFRESLFDALADDEGAAYWEGVYGQPIHTYSPYTAKGDTDYDDDPEHPRLERMDDEEYVAYVRSKMWEKSHQYIFEERKRREAERAKRKEKDEERRKWQVNMDEALGRGEDRKKRNRWKGIWEGYVKKWDTTFVSGNGGESMKDLISWPIESGDWKDVSIEEVERFFRKAPPVEEGREVDLGELLKKERVRWHPDKMQQRAGVKGIDAGTMKIVTAVFQVVDRLWGEVRGKV